jgi:hypothetical protein
MNEVPTMSQTRFTTDSLKELLLFPFAESDWLKPFAVGTLMLLASYLVPIIPLIFVAGYFVQVMRVSFVDRRLALPKWDDWSKIGKDGLRASIISLAYLAPGILILLMGFTVYFLATLMFPLALAIPADNVEAVAPVAGGLAFAAALIVLLTTVLVSTVLILLGYLLLPLAIAHAAYHESISAAFRFSELWSMLRSHLLKYLLAWIIVFGVGLAAGLLLNLLYFTVVLCCVAPLVAVPLSFYILLITGGVFGQVYYDCQQTP